MTLPYGGHYARLDALIDGMCALTDVWDLIGDVDQRRLLEVLLPGVTDVAECWEELADPLARLDQLDGRTACALLREQGVVGDLPPQDAYDRVRADIEWEIADVLRDYRRQAMATAVGTR